MGVKWWLIVACLVVVLVLGTAGAVDPFSSAHPPVLSAGLFPTSSSRKLHQHLTAVEKLRNKLTQLEEEKKARKKEAKKGSSAKGDEPTKKKKGSSSKQNLQDRFPYAVSLQDADRNHKCGGALIRTGWVLTAAQCVSPLFENSLEADRFIINIGGHDAGDPFGEDGEVAFPVQVVVHNDFNGDPKNGFDIALIQLPEPSEQKPTRVPRPVSKIKEGTSLVTLGWGSEESLSMNLQNAITLSRDLNSCNDPRSGWNGRATAGMLCAVGPPTGFCRGESGTPLVLPDSPSNLGKGNPAFDITVGISSYGDSSCRKNGRPGVYTSVSFFSDWITTTIDNVEAGRPAQPKKKVLSDPSEGKEPETVFANTPSPPGSSREPGDPDAKETVVRPVSPASRPTVCFSGCEKLNGMLRDAADSGHQAEIQKLLAEGADPEFMLVDERTPLFLASSNGHGPAVRVLVDAGANLEAQDSVQDTPLTVSARHGHTDVVSILIAAGANVDHKDSDGATALMAATPDNHLPITALLIAAGTDVNVQDVYGITALILASRYGHFDLVQSLLGAGASTTIETNSKRTALSEAQDNGHSDVAALLLQGTKSG